MSSQKQHPPGLAGRFYRNPYLLLTLAVFFWALNSVLGRYMRAEVPPIGLAFWRWAGASLLLLPFAGRRLYRQRRLIYRHLPLLLFLSLTGVAMFNTLLYTGLQTTTALNAFLVQALMPVLIMFFSFLLFRERITWLQGVGVVFSLVGVIGVIARGDFAILVALAVNRGDLLILVAVIGYALYTVTLRRLPQELHPLSFLAFTFVAGTLMLLPFYLHEHFHVKSLQLNLPTLSTVAYVVIFPALVSYFCYNRGVELLGANRAGLFIHLIPVFGTIMAILFLGEVFRWYHGIGFLLVFAGILLTLFRSRRVGELP
jgi:drug/metabolite transporter (DMT)-like permease